MITPQVRFKSPTSFLGRNGMAKCGGVDLLETMDGEEFILSALTSKGAIGRCEIWIPREHLAEVAEMLLANAKGGAK